MIKIFGRLRNYIKKSFDHIRNERLKQSLLQAIPFWIASVLTGLIAVGYTKVFGFAESFGTGIFDWNRWLLLAQAPVFFFIAWYIINRWAPYARGSGIPQVMAAIDLAHAGEKHDLSRLLSLKVAAIKILSSLFMVAGGGVVGREGPTIQISASIFKFVYRLIPRNWPKLARPNMIIAGAAAGLAAAFNTPLGGIVFAVEELSKTHISFYRTALFTGVIIAGLTAQALLGPYLYLGYPDVNNLSGYIFFIILIVAVLGGLGGSLLSRIILRIMKWKSTFTKTSYHILYLLVCALLIATLALFVSTSVMGSGKDTMQHLLFTGDKTPSWYLFPLRFAGPMICFTAGGSGGVFAPGLSAGAALGAVVAQWFHLQPADTNLLVLAGMVSFLTGITRTPFTSAILVLEMTDRHSVIFHLILAGMVAGLTSMLIDKKSFYEHLRHEYLIAFRKEGREKNSKKAEKLF